MTSQTLINKSPTKLSTATAVCTPESVSASYEARLLQAMKSQYHLDQQVKFLDLQAETESLLQQLKALKQQREAASENESGVAAANDC